MAEADMHCNVLQCRKTLSLEAEACVTSCSRIVERKQYSILNLAVDIFCLECSNKLFSEALVCPACNTGLPESGDIILSQLNPTEQYKSSALAGLKPEVVLDISSRAIAFYEYQVSQELCLKSILKNNIEEKYNALREQFNLMNRDLNHAVRVEKEKQAGILKEKELEKKRGLQLSSQLEEKTKQFQKLQIMYEKLKRKTIAPNIQQQQHNPIHTSSSVITSASIMKAPSVFGFKQSGDTVSRVSQTNGPKAFVSMPKDIVKKSDALLATSRIPSPTKSIYSMRSSRYMTSRHGPIEEPDTEIKGYAEAERHHHRHKHHRHRVKKM